MDPDEIQIYSVAEGRAVPMRKCRLPDEEWQRRLSPMQYAVARSHGTEPAFRNEYYANKRRGIYRCVCCGIDLFSSDDKFESGTGWPSFSRPVSDLNVYEERDLSYGMDRTEVRCRRCDAHLGHVFPDGPPPAGKRYCMNSASLRFDES
jgi:peptide-methionine (R)-S-oxide reductase